MTLRRPGKLLVVVPAGSEITTFGDWFVVAHPEHPPYLIDRKTGDRVEIDALSPDRRRPLPAPKPTLALEPLK